MTLEEIVTTVLASAGGSAIVDGWGGWLGKVWIGRILETQRAENARELELVKSHLELIRNQVRRNSDAQFELCQDLCGHLADLKNVGDNLWEHASRDQLQHFVVALGKARIATNRGRLILPEEQYQQLQSAFRAFEEFQFGKVRLIELRSSDQYDEVFRGNAEADVRSQVHQNGAAKERYERLLDQILRQFRSQLGLQANNALDPSARMA